MGTSACLAALAGLVLAPGAIAAGTASAPADAARARPGPALRAGLQAMEDGDGERAERIFAAVARDHPIVADHARLLRMDLLVATDRHEEAIALRHAWSHLDSPLTSEFHTLLGDAYAARGDEVAARNAWEFALQEAREDEARAALVTKIARSFDRVGDTERAGAAWLRVWTDYPTRAEAEAAAGHLDLLESGRSERLRTGDAWRRRGDSLYEARHNEGALAAYDAALGFASLRPAVRGHVLERRARTLFRLRRYPEAIAAFELLPPSQAVAIERERARARAGQVEEAARALERIAARASRGNAARARLIAAILWEGEGEVARARALYADVARRARGTASAREAIWRLGWSAYREGRLDEAIAHLDRLEPLARDAIDGLQARYWRARAREGQGDPAAPALFAALAGEFPLTYYGWRAGYRAGDRPLVASPPPLAPGRSVLSPGDLARPRVLLEAGLAARSRAELERLFRRARGLSDRLALATLFSESGDYHRAQRLVVDAYRVPMARGPVPDQLAVWLHAWPRPYEEEVRRATRDDALDPALVYAVMREESGYRPSVVSVSGARGLLQLMPTTAERVARDTGLRDFSPAALFLPEVNIHLGASYLSQLGRRFAGRPSAAIGSYNAGPHAVERWLGKDIGEDDVWVEAIPYAQTRGYVKRVLRSVHAYRVLY